MHIMQMQQSKVKNHYKLQTHVRCHGGKKAAAGAAAYATVTEKSERCKRMHSIWEWNFCLRLRGWLGFYSIRTMIYKKKLSKIYKNL